MFSNLCLSPISVLCWLLASQITVLNQWLRLLLGQRVGEEGYQLSLTSLLPSPSRVG